MKSTFPYKINYLRERERERGREGEGEREREREREREKVVPSFVLIDFQ